MENLTSVHQDVKEFYIGKEPALLGHINLWDPVLGWLNLIRALRVGLYHDDLHIE
jgi:hypothetical protein